MAASLAASGVAKVTPLEATGRWLVETDSRVGVVVGEGWELRILPHMAVPKLMFLLAYSLRPDGWREAVTGMDVERDVIEALATGFSVHAQRAVERGVLRGYLAVEERRPDLRGRVRFGDQLTRLPGLALPLEVAFDEFTADIHENRILRTAAEVLLRLPRIPPRARTRLLRLLVLLDEATTLADTQHVQLPAITRLNRSYEAALVLGKLILDGISLRQQRGTTATTAFLFDMNEVFESFVYAALHDSLQRYGGLVERQARGALDTASRPGLPLTADIVWRHHGAVRAVIDSKYKSLFAGSSMPNADAYQMLAYCIGFGVPRGYLVYARDSGVESHSYEIKRHGYQIVVEAVDVELEPELLLERVDALAARIARAAPGKGGPPSSVSSQSSAAMSVGSSVRS